MASSEKVWRSRAKENDADLKVCRREKAMNALDHSIYRESHSLPNLVPVVLAALVVILFVMWVFK